VSSLCWKCGLGNNIFELRWQIFLIDLNVAYVSISKWIKMNDQIRIEGINLSERLFAVYFHVLPKFNETLDGYCRILAEHQININFLSTGSVDNKGWMICCVAEEDADLLRELIGSEIELSIHVDFVPSVGLITIHPHQNNFKIFGATIRAISESGVPLYGLTSSISAFSLLTDYRYFKKGVQALRKFIEVNPEQIYFKEDLDTGYQDLQTRAVYNETRIKTYGFHKHLNLCLMELCFKDKNLKNYGSSFERIGQLGIRFELVLMQSYEIDPSRIYILFENKWKKTVVGLFEKTLGKDAIGSSSTVSPLGLIYFHGPHFGDRFGIVNAALRLFKKEDIQIIAVGCSGSSIYMVFSEKETNEAKIVLEREFEVPRYVKK
jgi:aspartokinase